MFLGSHQWIPKEDGLRAACGWEQLADSAEEAARERKQRVLTQEQVKALSGDPNANVRTGAVRPTKMAESGTQILDMACDRVLQAVSTPSSSAPLLIARPHLVTWLAPVPLPHRSPRLSRGALVGASAFYGD